MKTGEILIGFFSVVLLLASCNVSVNRTIYIEDGEKVYQSLSTVNGGIVIGKNCVVKGSCRSVNGHIEVGRNSSVTDLQTVNTKISLEENVQVNGDINSVNGSIRCDSSVVVRGGIGTINGDIELDNTEVRHDLTTYSGDITLTNNSTVGGDVIVKKHRRSSDADHRLRIEIRDNAVVEGDIIVRAEDVEVTVSLVNGGRVLGKIENAEVIRNESN